MSAPASTSSEILLDAGTNELEILVFRLEGIWFGVNVAKVREVIRPATTVSAPHQHPSVTGMFNIRGVVLPVVDLGKNLELRGGFDTLGAGTEGRVIIMEFNGLRTGFLVDDVEQIYRVSWQDVEPSPELEFGGAVDNPHGFKATTGVVKLNGRLVQMIDFESVADSILLEERLHVSSVENEIGVDRAGKRVILVEDSPFIRGLMERCLRDSGYERLEVYTDGLAAWEAIHASQTDIDAVISDIEMPRMDGLHLTKRLRASERFADVPVVLFSSLVSEDNRKKGEQVGATVQIPKPELPKMVRLVDRVCSGQSLEEATEQESLRVAA